MADDIRGGILITASHLCKIGELQGSSSSNDRRVGNRLHTVVSSVEADKDLWTPCVDRTRRRHRVLSLQRRSDILPGYAECRELRIGELDENLLGALADDVDFLDARHVQEVLADDFRLPNEIAHRHSLCLQGIEAETHVRIFVVDEWAHDAWGEIAGFVAKLLARLIELFSNRTCRRVILEGDGQESVTWPRCGLDAVVPGQFLNTFLKRLGDEVLHFSRCCTRPD
ncbi:hypothetical protein D3C87_1201910 [compost metagenome]